MPQRGLIRHPPWRMPPSPCWGREYCARLAQSPWGRVWRARAFMRSSCVTARWRCAAEGLIRHPPRRMPPSPKGKGISRAPCIVVVGAGMARPGVHAVVLCNCSVAVCRVGPHPSSSKLDATFPKGEGLVSERECSRLPSSDLPLWGRWIRERMNPRTKTDEAVTSPPAAAPLPDSPEHGRGQRAYQRIRLAGPAQSWRSSDLRSPPGPPVRSASCAGHGAAAAHSAPVEADHSFDPS